MTSHKLYDVIIIGAGPSGSSCAYNVKRLNPSASVLLIDKAQFPRYKPCGGGISPDVHNYLDFDLSEALDSRCEQLSIVANGQQEKASCDILMVRREHFDDFLVEKTKRCGVDVMTSCAVIDIENTKTQVTVKTKNGDFLGKIAVLAEGGAGKLARKLNISPNNNVAAALEYEHYQRQNSSVMEINFDHIRSGYAWVFPKSDGLSMGIGGFFGNKKKNKADDRAGLPKKLNYYLQQQNVNDINRAHLHGHPIQLYSGRKKLVHNRIMLIGEGAGCVDPLTAEGIRPAIKSGYLAAHAIAKAVSENNITELKKYNRAFHQNIGKDFRIARIATYFLNWNMSALLSSRLSVHTINRFMDIFSGRTTYRDSITLKKMVRIIKMGLYDHS